MALSEKEQRLLEQLEAALAEEDPRLANALRGSSNRALDRRKAALAGLGFVLGMALLVGGMQVGWVLSVVGFIVMLASTVVGLSAWQRVESEGRDPRQAPFHTSPFDNLDERWRRDEF